MTFQQLKYLLEVAQTGSVSQAARKLFVSSSSITIAMRKLEKELGFDLFFRNSQGLVPTQRGQKILEHAERICLSYDQLYTVQQDSVRTIRINCIDHPLIARSIARVMAENRDRQDLRFEITAYRPHEAIRRLINNELDISLSWVQNFAFGYWERQLKRAELHRQILKTVPACIQVGPGHRLYEAKRISSHDLKNESIIDNPHNSLSRTSLFAGIIYTSPERTIFVTQPLLQKELLLQGMGYRLTILPPPEERENTLLHSIPLDCVNYCISAVTNPQTPDPPEIARLLQLIKKELDEAYPEENAAKE